MKTKNVFLTTAISGAVIFGAPALAQDGLLEGWSGSASLGAVITNGNSDSRNITGSASVVKQQDLWRHTAFGSTYKAENNDIETADRFDLGYKLDRQFTDIFYGFGRLRYDTDDFGNIEDRVSGIVGVGRTFIDDGKQGLRGEIGIGGHSTNYISLDPSANDPTLDATGAQIFDPVTNLPVFNATPDALDSLDDSGAVLYGGLNYTNILNEIVTFYSVFSFEIAESNTYTTWDNSLAVKLSDNISLSLGILNRNNTDIVGPLGSNNDTATRISFVYGI